MCTPRNAIYTIIGVTSIDAVLHAHLLTAPFGPFAGETAGVCGPNPIYHSYANFFNTYWPVITILTVTIIPASAMSVFFLAIFNKIRRSHRIRIDPSNRRTRRQQYIPQPSPPAPQPSSPPSLSLVYMFNVRTRAIIVNDSGCSYRGLQTGAWWVAIINLDCQFKNIQEVSL